MRHCTEGVHHQEVLLGSSILVFDHQVPGCILWEVRQASSPSRQPSDPTGPQRSYISIGLRLGSGRAIPRNEQPVLCLMGLLHPAGGMRSVGMSALLVYFIFIARQDA